MHLNYTMIIKIQKGSVLREREKEQENSVERKKRNSGVVQDGYKRVENILPTE